MLARFPVFPPATDTHTHTQAANRFLKPSGNPNLSSAELKCEALEPFLHKSNPSSPSSVERKWPSPHSADPVSTRAAI